MQFILIESRLRKKFEDILNIQATDYYVQNHIKLLDWR